MSTYALVVCGLAAFDVVLVAGVFLLLRRQRRLTRGGRVAMAVGLSGFVFHAALFLEGAVLYLQLATLAALLIAVALVPPYRPSAAGPGVQP